MVLVLKWADDVLERVVLVLARGARMLWCPRVVAGILGVSILAGGAATLVRQRAQLRAQEVHIRTLAADQDRLSDQLKDLQEHSGPGSVQVVKIQGSRGACSAQMTVDGCPFEAKEGARFARRPGHEVLQVLSVSPYGIQWLDLTQHQIHTTPRSIGDSEVTVCHIEREGGEHRACISLAGTATPHRAGDILQVDGIPVLLVTAISCAEATFVDLGTGRSFAVRAREPHVPWDPLKLQVNAIAGNAPNYVAVIEWDGQTYIVQKGTRLPEEHPILEVTDVGADNVVTKNLSDHLSHRFALDDLDI